MSLTVQFQTLATMMMMGLVIGLNLDFYQRLTVQVIRKVWTRAIGDILFWVVQALLVFYVLLQANEGELRVYVFFALLAGFVVYRKVGRPPFLSVLERGFTLADWLRRLSIAILQVILIYPLKFVLKLTTSSVMIGLTLITNILSILMKLLLFPLKLIGYITAPLFKRIIPLPIITFTKKVYNVIRQRLKKWWNFK
ncbi:spore cortex biosynthesis protein YabQ [Salibacterium salarium]|uniref:Spore cortex biosynthesis protein YabQ n=1 Tax=Salibacterium salarium TaxID=284579 RepID=A0A3R9PXA9_9BACI|nr:spore cortex biosynthesis protein YabQ [Salibacterium salarium]RSL29037.1 spore cortex biosynthesis protein YabQ [Salibacterium salarium]